LSGALNGAPNSAVGRAAAAWQLPSLDKPSIDEGHGFSRATLGEADEGFSP
jgi:hypothetical protein